MRRFLCLSLGALLLASVPVASSGGTRADVDPVTSAPGQARLSFDVSPAWSPDGGFVAFERSTELANWDFSSAVHVVSVRSGKQRMLVAGYAPSWSPDGSRITFDVHLGLSGIYTIKLDETDRRRLTNLSDSYPRWSPDGKNILFWRTPRGDSEMGAMPLYVVPSSGGSAHRVARASAEQDAEWSPDGTRIVFWTEFHGGETAVMVVGRDGRGLRNLGDGGWPSWSPDGREVAFVCVEGGFRVCIMRPDGSHVRKLVPGTDPHFSPTGSELTFQRRAIWIVNVDGSHPRRLTHPPKGTSDVLAAWSPDARALAFTRISKRRSRIWIINRDGTNEHRLSG